MYRTYDCGALRLSHVGTKVTLSGWVATKRDLGGMTFVDLRDRYGITQLAFNMEDDADLCHKARTLGREYVVQVVGLVRERTNKNPNRPTGEIEIEVRELTLLNASKVPPFTIEDDTDGGEELRMQYRYLDLRRSPVQSNIIFRSQVAQSLRRHLTAIDFVEVETPFLIKSTPEGARDFVVPSRLNQGEFYALPQSPQTFKQLLMVSGLDRYFQIVKCFRDEDLRADRQPEFTQLDCEMAFVTQDQVLDTFETLVRNVFSEILDVELPSFPRMNYDEAMSSYGIDKPDIRFDMLIHDIGELVKGHGFAVFDQAEYVAGICVQGCADQYSNKDLKKLTDWVRRPQIGAGGLVYAKWDEQSGIKSSMGKFFDESQIQSWFAQMGGGPGDMLLILCGEAEKTQKQMGQLRLEIGDRMGLRDPEVFAPLWVVDFPLLEWDEDLERFHAMHHPFTSPKQEDRERMLTADRETMKSLRADAYDMVINGVEIGGGSIRIHDKDLQKRNFDLLGFSDEEAQAQFGFLMGAFEYGAPPHGGIALGFDRLCALMRGKNNIRDFIAFPKNNQGRDVMIDAPAPVDREQLDELGLDLRG